jgi:putative FmdB family regulatory protein
MGLSELHPLWCSTEVVMPRYGFYCEDCKKPFEVILSLAEYEKGKIKCPKCGCEHIHQEAAAFFAVTSKKS